jgi:Transglycosylase SLT domain
MKYLGVAFACCTAVIMAAAIYLMGTPNVAPPAAAEVDISSTLPNISTPSEIPAALSQYELTSLSAEQFTGDGPKPDQARVEAESPARQLAGEATVGASLPGSELQAADLQASPDPAASSDPAADPGPPSQNEALLPHQSSAADDTANRLQARWEENSPESAEPSAEYSTALATEDFDYTASANAATNADITASLPDAIAPVVPDSASRREPLTNEQKTEEAKLEESTSPARDVSSGSFPPNHSYLAYYVYDERPPVRKPADLALDALKNVPIGTPLQEIKRAAAAFGLDYNFMKAVAKVESDFDPKQRTGSYIGLFQLSHYEFAKYGSGDILNPRDNAIAAAYKFINEGTQFEWDTHKNPTYSDLYLIHQQGWQGAAEHVSHPEWIAWKSMCATDEGKEKGEKWCKRAIWQNTLPAIKHLWKSVENLPSSAFVTMWRQRIDRLYARYSDMVTAKQDVDVSRQQPKTLESHCAKPGSCHSQASGKSISNKSLRQRVSRSRRRLVPGGNARNVHALVSVRVQHS